MKFATHMVYYVLNGRASDEIYKSTKELLQTKNSQKLTGFMGQQECDQRMVQKLSLQSLNSQSCSSLSYSQQSSENSFGESSAALGGSNSSLNRSSLALRENFQSGEKSNRKFGSESNLNASKSSSSLNLMKAKRQISF